MKENEGEILTFFCIRIQYDKKANENNHNVLKEVIFFGLC